MTLLSQKINDAYYTPQETCLQFQTLVGNHTNALDPCAGDGRLYPQAAKKWDLPRDFLKEEPQPFDVVVMNPPFTYDRQFVNHALAFAPVVWAILPMSWNKIGYDCKVPRDVEKILVEKCLNNYFELPDGERRFVNCGIFRFTKVYNRCFLDRKKLFNKKTLLKMTGIEWACQPERGNVFLRTHGSSAGTYFTEMKNKNTTRALFVPKTSMKLLPKAERQAAIAQNTAGIPCFGCGEFTEEVVCHFWNWHNGCNPSPPEL